MTRIHQVRDPPCIYPQLHLKLGGRGGTMNRWMHPKLVPTPTPMPMAMSASRLSLRQPWHGTKATRRVWDPPLCPLQMSSQLHFPPLLMRQMHWTCQMMIRDPPLHPLQMSSQLHFPPLLMRQMHWTCQMMMMTMTRRMMIMWSRIVMMATTTTTTLDNDDNDNDNNDNNDN